MSMKFVYSESIYQTVLRKVDDAEFGQINDNCIIQAFKS